MPQIYVCWKWTVIIHTIPQTLYPLLEVLRAVTTMKPDIFCAVMPCSLVEVYWHCRETSRYTDDGGKVPLKCWYTSIRYRASHCWHQQSSQDIMSLTQENAVGLHSMGGGLLINLSWTQTTAKVNSTLHSQQLYSVFLYNIMNKALSVTQLPAEFP
jgi:hypothetical protein